MWRINTLRCLYSNTPHKFPALQISRHFSKPSRHPHNKPHKPLNSPPETPSLNPLFKEITQILGSGLIIPPKTPTNPRNDDPIDQSKTYLPPVCENANRLQEDIDVSPVVDEVTRVIRAKNGGVSMEKRLDELGFRFDGEIVGNVLKRCFKVPRLAYRFFNWVKLKDGFFHSIDSYNTMLYIVGEAREFEFMDGLVEEMEKEKCEMGVKTWDIVISQYGKAKMVGKALFLFEKMKKSGCEPDERVYRTMVRCLCNGGKGEIAMEVYKEMVKKEMRLDLRLYKILLNAMAKLGDVDAVNLISDDMVKVVMIPERDVRVCMLKSFCVAGRIREALELIREFNGKEIALDYECFETLLRGLCRAGRITDALEIIEIMKRKNLVDSKVYGIIVNGYLKRKELSKAMEVFESMKKSGYQPTVSTYTELMQNLFDSCQYQKGFELYNEMLDRGIEVDSVAIMAAVAGHIRQNRISEAWEAFNTMEHKGIKPTWKSYSIFIKELCKLLKTDETLEVLEKMQASMISIDSTTFKWVIACMEKNGEADNVEKVKQMQRICRLIPVENEISGHPELSMEREPLGNEISGQLELQVEREPNHDQADEKRVKNQFVRPRSKGYNEQDRLEICRILSSSSDWSIIEETLGKCTILFTPELVVEVLRNCRIHGKAALQYFSWVGMQDGYKHTTETYNMAMKISGRGKDFEHMRTLFNEMRRNRCLITPDTWAVMIIQYGRAGLTEIALKFFNEMKDGGYVPTDSTYKYLIVSVCGKKGRKIDEAVKIFHEMIHAGYIPDKETVATYLGCLCEAGKLSEARKCEDSLCKIGFTFPITRSLHIRALCRAGKLEEALSLLNEAGTERSTLDEYTYATFVHALLRNGREEEALAKVESMKEVGIRPTVHVYTSFIVHYLKEKRIEKATEMLEKMQQEGCEPTIVTYSALIRGYMDSGKDVDAWNVFNNLKEKGPRPDFKMYSMLMNCLCKTGKSEEALKLLSEMLENGIVPSTINFRTVSYGLNREGKHDLAQTVQHKKIELSSKRKFLT